MNKHTTCAQWMLFLGLTVCLAATGLARAGQPKDKLDLKAEAEQAAKEEAEQAAERAQGIRGKHQRMFFGAYYALAETSEKLSPEVVGSFVTNQSDQKPGRSFLVKVENGDKGILEALKRFDKKNAQVTGKLRNEDKYLIISAIVEVGPTPPVLERRRPGGI